MTDATHAQESAALIAWLLAAKPSPAAQIDRFTAMVRRYPGLGWEQAVAEAEQRLTAQEHEEFTA